MPDELRTNPVVDVPLHRKMAGCGTSPAVSPRRSLGICFQINCSSAGVDPFEEYDCTFKPALLHCICATVCQRLESSVPVHGDVPSSLDGTCRFDLALWLRGSSIIRPGIDGWRACLAGSVPWIFQKQENWGRPRPKGSWSQSRSILLPIQSTVQPSPAWPGPAHQDGVLLYMKPAATPTCTG